jgi:alpha-tubulin suppressor-like RCC1 family protein
VGQIAAGQHHSLALTAGGDALFAWGRADYGQLGFGKAAKETAGAGHFSPKRVPIPEGTIMSQVISGESTSAVITQDSRLYTWGYEGVTGHDGKYLNRVDCTSPLELKITGVSRVRALAMGSQFSVMLVDKSTERDVHEGEAEIRTERVAKRQKY